MGGQEGGWEEREGAEGEEGEAMDAVSTLRMYQEQLAHVSLLPPSEDLELLK